MIVEGETPATMAKSTGLGLLELPTMFDARCHTKVDFSLVPDVDLMSDERHSLLPYIQWNVN